MKKALCLVLVALMALSSVYIPVFANDNVGYVSYNKGNDSNDGLSDSTPKKSIGAAYGNGVFGIVSNGGTVVVCEKMYFGVSYTWKASAPTTITAVYNGKSYINTSPASNPASGVVKIKSGCTLTVASDLTFDNIILHSESFNETIVVKNGATLTVTDTVITTTNSNNTHFKIIVEKGGKAIIHGGTFASITGDGTIVLGGSATVAGGADANGAVGYISYNKGSNSNSGTSDTAPKASLGQMDGIGVVGIVSQGGTVVVCEKMYVGSSFAWCAAGPVTITASYGGKDYKNTSPASNPASGVIKFRPGSTFTVGSSITLDDVILFQEYEQCNIVVSPGATFTVNESVITMSNREWYMNVYVSKGATAIINGGTFSSVSGEGTIKIGPKAKVLQDKPSTETEIEYSSVATAYYVNLSAGNNKNSGKSADKAIKDYTEGLFKRMLIGGTAVICGSSRIGGLGANKEFTFALPMPVTFTSVYDGVDYKNADNCALSFTQGTTFIVSTDVVFDDIILLSDTTANTILVKKGAALTVTDKAILNSKTEDGTHYSIIAEEGSVVILSALARETFKVSGEGTVLTYVDGKSEIFTYYLGENWN